LKVKNVGIAKWKWIVVAGLLAWAFVLSGLPFNFSPLKPKLAPRGKLAPVWDGAYAKLVLKWHTNASKSAGVNFFNRQPAAHDFPWSSSI